MTELVTAEQRDQYAAVRAASGYARGLRRTQLQLSGKDRGTFLHAFCTADIASLVTGQGCEAFITSVQGKTLGLVHVFCRQDSLLLDTVAGQAEGLVSHLDRYVIREEVTFTDQSDQGQTMLIAGPEAGQTLVSLVQSSIPEDPLGHVEVAFAGHPLSIRRCPTPLDGFWIHGDATSLDALTPLLADDGCREIDETVVEMLRVEAGIPCYGVDLDDQNLPQEVNRDTQAISFTKGCYLGQETVARIDALGHVNRLLTGLALPPGPLPRAGMVIEQDGREAARVTSSSYSPRLGRPLAMAYVRREASTPGTVLEGAEVVSLPLD